MSWSEIQQKIKSMFASDELGHERLSNTEFNAYIKDKAVVLLDVRTPQEFQMGHIKGARNINLTDGSFGRALETFKAEKQYAVYCQGGSRSYQAAKAMKQRGFDVVELRNGYGNWRP